MVLGLIATKIFKIARIKIKTTDYRLDRFCFYLIYIFKWIKNDGFNRIYLRFRIKTFLN